MDSTTDLIVAPATAPQPAARSIVRLTGEGLRRCFVPPLCFGRRKPDSDYQIGIEDARNVEVRFHPGSLGATVGRAPCLVTLLAGSRLGL